jgi:hypothetical protein
MVQLRAELLKQGILKVEASNREEMSPNFR